MSTFHFSPRANRAAEINWREWSEAAFAEAHAQNKPILLGISAVWCHWCHVMDETTYSTPAVISLINERYLPIRVDNDRRPDVNARYNMGGWPTTALLTSDGEILKGGTYIPPDAMLALLDQIAAFYAKPDVRLAIAQRVAQLKRENADRPILPRGGGLDADTAANVEKVMSDSFDEQYGGFGDEPKFPQTESLHFLLDLCARGDDGRARTMVQKTLHGMAGGGMYDRVEGGFFRYSTTRDYSVPHFEKMLEDLSGLTLACTRALALFEDPQLGQTAIDTKRYLDGSLWNAAYGAYGGSQDADEAYYALDAAGRRTRPAPYVDPTVYTSWNAAAARALILSEPLLARAGIAANGWIERGLVILQTLWSKLLVDGMMCRYYDGKPQVRGLLGDQAWSIWAALSAFSVTGEAVWLGRAGDLFAAAEALYDEEAAGYADRLAAADETGRIKDKSIPLDDNALMARALLAYADFTAQQRFRDRAHAVLAQHAARYRSLGTFAAGYAAAVLEAQSPPLDVKIVGSPDADAVRAMRASAAGAAKPPLRIDTIDPKLEGARLSLAGYSNGTEPAAYLCRDGACFARVSAADDLAAELGKAASN
ncbi:MAG: DUF255 domain-containing protein [Candidatus Eremiobacteraeota bacterium]|nr:DUF255 domain-containing protein [Candidatus Eremiobacteraeota bacterium]